MKAALWCTSTTHLLPIPTILPISGVAELSFSEKRGLILTEQKEVLEVQFPSLEIKRIPIVVQVDLISCYNDTAIMIGSGSIYTWGSDEGRTGVLGSGSHFHEEPQRVDIPAYITKGSLSSHAAAIDSTGKVFTWGLGESGQLGRCTSTTQPAEINSNNLFKANEVVCGPTFTAVLTDGCYVYIYGSIGRAHQVHRKGLKTKNSGFSHPELEKMTVVQISAGETFLAVLNESGEVFAFDACMDLIKLPVPQGISIHRIASSRDMAFGLSDDEIIEWGQGSRKSENNTCVITTWAGRYYKLEKPYSQRTKIFSSAGSKFSMSFLGGKSLGSMPLGIKAFVVNPYKRSEYMSKLIDNAFDSVSPSSSPKREMLSKRSSFGDLSRLYSIGDNENTIQKLIKYRRESEFTKSVCKVVHRRIEEFVKEGFKAIKEQAAMKKKFEKTLAAALILTPLEKLIQKNIISKCIFAYKCICLHSDEEFSRMKQRKAGTVKMQHARNEFVMKFISIYGEKLYKSMFYGFTMIKELEMRRLQKKTAVLSIGQVLSRKILRNQKYGIGSIRLYFGKLQRLFNILLDIHLKSLKASMKQINQVSKFKAKRASLAKRVVLTTLKKFQMKEKKECIIKWRKVIEGDKTLLIKKHYQKQIGSKSIALILSYTLIRHARTGFYMLKAFNKPKNYRLIIPSFISKIKKILINRKKSTFRIVKRLKHAHRLLKIIFQSLKKARKYHIRQSFKKVEIFAISKQNSNKLQLSVNLIHTLSKIFSKHLRKPWATLKQQQEKSAYDLTGPSYSFFSPKINKHTCFSSTTSFPEVDTPPSNFNFTHVPRLKKINTMTHSYSIYETPKSVVSMQSPRDRSSGRSMCESAFKKTLAQKKASEVQKGKQAAPNSSKPPLKPPWKPASTTVASSNKKPIINSTVRRSQYSVQLKQRVKSHSKNPSTDLSASTPSMTSRNTSRQKTAQYHFDSLDTIFANFKYAAIILDNLRHSIQSKRMLESLCKIRYCGRLSPKVPAPRPLDSQIYQKMPLWQSNLYKIGFEKLKKITKMAIGRGIIKMILCHNSRQHR